ncbi:hypothetical protein GDO81_022030 [Engystomops pustulosus]|uniref:Uncharacterized protein n=1 Tax=Engystomops pustulosus TaxID=76066 RepID=A0AAV6ZFQ2_ENGPU|nr:hypothetical protein GDO81_022030 [Engystomops pustulosus]
MSLCWGCLCAGDDSVLCSAPSSSPSSSDGGATAGDRQSERTVQELETERTVLDETVGVNVPSRDLLLSLASDWHVLGDCQHVTAASATLSSRAQSLDHNKQSLP